MRPYIICHMVTSLDGKVTGHFLTRPECARATEIYYDINRRASASGFICGRVTMEENFTNGWYPELSCYEAKEKTDYLPEELSGFYAVAFDSKGRLGWKSNCIEDEDPGYGGAQIIEVLSSDVDPRYLGFLQEKGIPYIFAGESRVHVPTALNKLRALFGAETLLLEGGSEINGAFQRAGVIDELSLVVAPLVAEGKDKPLFYDAATEEFELIRSEVRDGVLILNFKKR